MKAAHDPPFDVGGLERFLADEELTRGSVELEPIGDGHSNLTYLVSDGEAELVLRRPPPPPLPPGAHDVLREARVQRALHDSAVPVPRILAVDDSRETMDVPFYVMEHVEGTVATEATPPALDTPEGRRGVAAALVDTLAALHAVDWQAVGLEDFGRPSSDVERHLWRFGRLLGEELPPGLADLLDRLLLDPPAPHAPAIVHGDFRLGNVMMAPRAPARIAAVLDWELATLGDPLRDLGYLLATYAVPDEPLHALTEMSRATLAEGYPAREELAERYAEARGEKLPDMSWYVAMALWKLAVLFEYSRRRGEDPYYAQPALVGGLLDAGRRAVDGARKQAPA